MFKLLIIENCNLLVTGLCAPRLDECFLIRTDTTLVVAERLVTGGLDTTAALTVPQEKPKQLRAMIITSMTIDEDAHARANPTSFPNLPAT